MGLKKAQRTVFGVFLVGIALLALPVFAAKYEPLTDKKLASMVKQHCTLVLPWASWCTFCLEELPEILPALNVREKIHPVVLDLSRPYVQEKFSRKFMEKLDLKYVTYRIPMEVKEDAYRRVLDPTWKGALPTAFLFTCEGGKCGLKQRWDRKIGVDTLDEILVLCSNPKKP